MKPVAPLIDRHCPASGRRTRLDTSPHSFLNSQLMRLRLPSDGLTSNSLILLVAVFLTAFGNLTFFGKVLKTYGFSADTAPALISLAAMVVATSTLLLALVCFWRTTKPVLIVVLLLSALVASFMDSYGVVIGTEMLQNVARTDVAEARDLINLKLIAYFVLLGLIPAFAVSRIPLRWRGLRVEALARGKLLAIIVAAHGGNRAGIRRLLRLLPAPAQVLALLRQPGLLHLLGNPVFARHACGKGWPGLDP